MKDCDKSLSTEVSLGYQRVISLRDQEEIARKAAELQGRHPADIGPERCARTEIPSYTYPTLCKVLKCTSKLSSLKQIWRVVLPLVLAALLIASTLGGIAHHHGNAPADNCPICHLNHQAVAATQTSIRVSVPIAAGPRPEPQEDNFPPSPAVRRIPVRGPPA